MRRWVESGGAPMVVVPVTALADWHGCVGSGTGDDDEDSWRAYAVDGWAAAIPVGRGGAQALVIGPDPANVCYVPELCAFVRWLGADDGEALITAAGKAIADPATDWADCGTWSTDGPAVMLDALEEGATPDDPHRTLIPFAPSRWRVRGTYAEFPRTTVGVVQLLPWAE